MRRKVAERPDGAVVEEEEWGVVMVKTMARGKQRSRAQRRERGVGESMMTGLLTVFHFLRPRV